MNVVLSSNQFFQKQKKVSGDMNANGENHPTNLYIQLVLWKAINQNNVTFRSHEMYR